MDRRRLSLLLSALLLAAPASAHADFTETPTYDFLGETRCVAPTGLSGEVAIGSASGARFLQATRGGFAVSAEVKAGEDFRCGTISGRPSGAGLIAGTQYGGDSVVAVVRDPGGAWSAPLPVAAREGWSPDTVVGAVSDRGDAVVAWVEQRQAREPAIRIRIAQRAPGQGFGPAKVVHTSARMSYAATLDAAVASTGEAVVTWTTLDESAKGPVRTTSNVAIIGADGTVGAPTPIDIEDGAPASLSLAADGRALLAYVRNRVVTFIERPPGGAFGAPIKLARVADPVGGTVIARLHESGAAAIAWTGFLQSETRIATRPGLGGFRPPVTVAEAIELPKGFDTFWFSDALQGSGLSFAYGSDFTGDSLTLTADGRALVGTMALGRPGGVERALAQLVTLPLAGGAAVRATAGGAFDEPTSVQPLTLADGTPALTWLTDVSENRFTLHLATEGGTRPAAGPPPRLRVGDPVRRVLDYDDALRLPVDCSGPCTIRGQVIGRKFTDGVTTLATGGKGELRINAGYESLVPKGGRSLRVRVTYGTPGTVTPQTRTVIVRVSRTTKRDPRVVRLRAVRRGSTVRVTWRVVNPQRFSSYIVSGTAGRNGGDKPLVVSGDGAIRPRTTSYKVTLKSADRVRFVTLRGLDGVGFLKPITMKVR